MNPDDVNITKTRKTNFRDFTKTVWTTDNRRWSMLNQKAQG